MTKNMRYLAPILACLVLVGCSAPEVSTQAQGSRAVAPAGAIQDPTERGKQHYAGGQFGLALVSFQEALAARGDSVETLNAIAATYDRLERYDLAVRYYERALELDPNSTQTLNNLGYSLILQRKYDLAVRYLEMARNGEIADGAIVANLALAGGMIGQGPVAASPRLVADTDRRRFAMWIERSSAGEQTLVTKPGPDLALSLWQHDVDPRLGHMARGDTLLPLAAVHRPRAGGTNIAAEFTVQTASLIVAAPLAKTTWRADKIAVEVANASDQAGLATRWREYLRARGLRGASHNEEIGVGRMATVILYRRGYLSAAQAVAQRLPLSVQFWRRDDLKADVRLELGADFGDPDRMGLWSRIGFDEDVAS